MYNQFQFLKFCKRYRENKLKRKLGINGLKGESVLFVVVEGINGLKGESVVFVVVEGRTYQP